MTLAFALVMALAPPSVPHVEARTSGCVPMACEDEVNDAFIIEGRCRERDWSCCNDPVESCAGLMWMPVRVGVAAALIWIFGPLCCAEPKMGRKPLPDLDGVALFFAFGLPMYECPARSAPPPPAPPKPRPPARPEGERAVRY